MSNKRKTKDQTISVAEFKQWLSGVEDMQPGDWIPNSEQWKKIRAKIAQLSDEMVAEEASILPAAPQTYYAPPVPMPQVPHYQQTPLQHRAPPQQSSLGDEMFIPRATPEDRAMDGGSSLPGFNAQQYD